MRKEQRTARKGLETRESKRIRESGKRAEAARKEQRTDRKGRSKGTREVPFQRCAALFNDSLVPFELYSQILYIPFRAVFAALFSDSLVPCVRLLLFSQIL